MKNVLYLIIWHFDYMVLCSILNESAKKTRNMLLVLLQSIFPAMEAILIFSKSEPYFTEKFEYMKKQQYVQWLHEGNNWLQRTVASVKCSMLCWYVNPQQRRHQSRKESTREQWQNTVKVSYKWSSVGKL